MAIICFEFDRSKVPAGAMNVTEHVTDSVKKTPYWTWHEYAGLCLRDREMNGYDDSDFYMTVWDEAKQEPREIMFASTRGWTYPSYGSFVDATPEVLAAYNAWAEKQRAALNADREVAEKRVPKVGRNVVLNRSVRGKSACAEGERGTVFWYGKDRFDATGYRYRVGIKLDDGRKVFVTASAVDVVEQKEEAA